MAVSTTSVSYTSATITASASSTASKDRYWTIYLNGAEYDYVYSKAQSISYTFYGLDEGTTYSVSVRYGPNYDDYSAGSTSFTTNVSISYDADYAYVSYSRSHTSITINITSITSRNYSREARFVIGNTRYTKTVGAYQTSVSYTFTGLTPGTSYYFEVGLRAPDNTRTFYESLGYISTLSYDYTLSFDVSCTATTITPTVTLTSGILNYDVDLTFKLDGARALEADITAGNTSRSRTWNTSITPATEYVITLTDKLRDKEWTITIRTKNNFSWSDWGMNVSQGATFYINADGWNEYTSQLSAKASYYGKSYNPATVSKGDTLTAEKYNNIAAVINWLVDNNKGDCSTKLNGVEVGDPVTAAKINYLATCLNE